MSLGGRRDPVRGHRPVSRPMSRARSTDAVARGAIVVAAGDDSGQSGESGRGPGVCLGWCPSVPSTRTGIGAPVLLTPPYLTLVAPGVGIASLGRVPGAAYLGDGTSQATAITSARAGSRLVEVPVTGQADRSSPASSPRSDHRAPAHDPAYGLRLAGSRPGHSRGGTSVMQPTRCTTRCTPFLDREQARAAAASSEPAPQPAATTNAPPGTFEEGAEPGTFTGPVLAGTVAALVGIAILAMLGGMALASRRERPSPIPVAPPPAWPTESSGVSPPEWQDITRADLALCPATRSADRLIVLAFRHAHISNT